MCPAVACSARARSPTSSPTPTSSRTGDRIDAFASEAAASAALEDSAPDRPAPTAIGTPATEVDLAGVDTVVWATGYRPSYPWLDNALLDRRGQIVHEGGVMAAPGLYVLGLPLLRRRTSSFLDGIGADTADLTAHLRAHLDHSTAAA